MTAPITSARVRELSAKATDGPWSVAPKQPLVHRWKQPGADPTGSVLVAECGDYRDKEIARFNMERWCADAALIAALCSEPARNHIAKALDLLERMQAGEAELVAKVAMLLDHPSVFMGGPSVQSKRKAGYLLHELAALVGEG